MQKFINLLDTALIIKDGFRWTAECKSDNKIVKPEFIIKQCQRPNSELPGEIKITKICYSKKEKLEELESYDNLNYITNCILRLYDSIGNIIETWHLYVTNVILQKIGKEGDVFYSTLQIQYSKADYQSADGIKI